MDKANTILNRTLKLERTFNAPVKLVWEAWTEPAHIAKWWGPKGMQVIVITHDFRVGGKWKYSMPMPDGTAFVSEGEYSEIVPMEKIITSANFIPMTVGVVLHAEFEAVGNTTKFTFSVVHPTPEYCQQQEKMGFYNGWGSTFERLDSYLQTTGS